MNVDFWTEKKRYLNHTLKTVGKKILQLLFKTFYPICFCLQNIILKKKILQQYKKVELVAS